MRDADISIFSLFLLLFLFNMHHRLLDGSAPAAHVATWCRPISYQTKDKEEMLGFTLAFSRFNISTT